MSDITPDWPLIEDDDGSGKSGTPVNNPNVWDLIKAAINAQVASEAHPDVTPAQIIDEVVAAREDADSLDEHLNQVINSDGTLIVPDTVVSKTQGESLPQGNLIPNGDMRLWPDGDDKPPTYFEAVTNDLLIERSGAGSGLSTTLLKYGQNCAFIPIGAASNYPAYAPHEILTVDEFAFTLGLRGRKLAFGMRAVAGDANCIGIAIYDGIETTVVYHSGGGQEEWVSGQHTINAAATRLQLRVIVATENASTALVGCIACMFSDIPIADFFPPPMQPGTIHFMLAGNAAPASDIARFIPGAPGIVTRVVLTADMSGGGTLCQVDVLAWNKVAAVSQSIFASGGPSVNDTQNVAMLDPDGDYYRRCFKPMEQGAAYDNGTLLSWDIDTVTNTVASVVVEVRTLQYIRLLEAFKLPLTSIGNGA